MLTGRCKAISILFSVNSPKCIVLKTMHTFTQKLNPITGKMEWVQQPENYDYMQEIARSAYGDMLHDTERNHKYYLAIKKAIAKVKQQGKAVKVLDIGTGTGLLSMMAATCGADRIYACEAFKPVAKCALNVIKDNGFENRIKIIPKRSTELTVGVGGDLPERANVLVTEVFDTELIGEGALCTFRHAFKMLLEKNCVVVPSSATIYAQIVESELLSNFCKVRPFRMNESRSVVPPPIVERCPGSPSVHDIQMAEISPDCFRSITDPCPVFHFQFDNTVPVRLENCSTVQITAKQSGNCEIVFMWWELNMDDEGDILLSCAPPWAHPEPEKRPWRDHWLQAIYYLPKSLYVSEGSPFQLQSSHDEYSVWFNVLSSKQDSRNMCPIPRPLCTCLVHCTNSRSRMGMLNDPVRREKHLRILREAIMPSSVALFVGSNSLLPLVIAKLGAEKVFVLDSLSFPGSSPFSSIFIKYNQVESKVKYLGQPAESLSLIDLEYRKVEVLVAEPYFSTAMLPWEGFLHFWHTRTALDQYLSNSVQITPEKATVKAVAVEFKDLWKIRAPVIKAEGFNLSAFDKMTQEAMTLCDSPIEPQPLWEYPCKPLTAAFELMSFNSKDKLGEKQDGLESSGTEAFFSHGQCNGVAVWMEYQTGDSTITTGPTQPLNTGEKITWDMYTSQGVYFIHPPVNLTDITKEQLYYKITFNPNSVNLNFDFKVQK